MDQLLTRFVHALRNAEIRVSTAETLDAVNAVRLVGYRDRQLLKDSLALTLPKTQDEKAAFDACFEQFFSFRGQQLPPVAEAPDAEEAGSGQDLVTGAGGAAGHGGDDATRDQPHDIAARSAKGSGATQTESADGISTAADLPQPSSALGQLLMRGDEGEINVAISIAGRQVNVQEIEVFTQKGVYTRRILEALGNGELQQEIDQLSAGTLIGERRLAQTLGRRRDWLRERVRGYVEQQFLLHADVTGRRLREDLLRNVRLSGLGQRDHRIIQELILRMARRLTAAYSRRRRVFRRGQLHVPRTLRRNMRYDDGIFELRWKATKVARPRVFAICDVSGSVADYARFMLMFLYSLDEVLPKVRSFAFSAGLGEVSELFARHGIEEATALALNQHGGGATDYGQALADFHRLCFEELDRRSTVIILGDARNNYGDPRSELLQEIHERSRRVLWLNPEARAMWDTGDSQMRQFAPYCHYVAECGTLTQLERVVSRLVRATA